MNEIKTLKFDALIDKILNELVPHTRICIDCKKEFKIEKEDIDLLRMLRVPAPTLCPECRQRRRLTFSNYSSIYKRKCDVPNHTDIMVSPVAPVMPWITYDYDTYYSDLWDPFSFGKEINSIKRTFDQIYIESNAFFNCSINYDTVSKKLSYITPDIKTPLQQDQIRELFFDHQIYFNEYRDDIDYCVVQFNSQEQEKDFLPIYEKIFYCNTNFYLSAFCDCRHYLF